MIHLLPSQGNNDAGASGQSKLSVARGRSTYEGNVRCERSKAVRRFIVRLVVLVLVLFGAVATPAVADVHAVSNAGCAAPGAPSGATTAASRAAPGRPDAPIPVTASDDRTQGRGGDADAQGTNC